jgi:hypothetical protein
MTVAAPTALATGNSGCGFYRPDPSYPPAIEQHVNDLKADRETAMAMDADEYVLNGMSDQINAFAGRRHHHATTAR